MCIAVAKKKGFEIPSKEILKSCWENNPDGAGIMFNDGIEVHGYKGFTTFKGFYKFLKRIDNQYNLKEKDLVLHFRIATHGGICRENTHPFPVSNVDKELRSFDWKSQYGFAHNGIIFGYGSKTQGGLSDTMEYIKYIINSIPCLEEAETLLHNLACEHSSRFVTMTKDNILLGGDWKEDDGIYYSNGTYISYKPTVNYKWDFKWDKKYGTYNDYYIDDYKEVDDMDDLEVCDECNKITSKLYNYSGMNICSDCLDMYESILLNK